MHHQERRTDSQDNVHLISSAAIALGRAYPKTAARVIDYLGQVPLFQPRLAMPAAAIVTRISGAIPWREIAGINLYSRARRRTPMEERTEDLFVSFRDSAFAHSRFPIADSVYADAIQALRPFSARLHSAIGFGFTCALGEFGAEAELTYLSFALFQAAVLLVADEPRDLEPWITRLLGCVQHGNHPLGFDQNGSLIIAVA